VPFVQKGFAPFDEFAVHLLDDLSAERAIAPLGKRDGSPQRSPIFLHGRGHALADARTGHDGSQMAGEHLDQGVVRAMRQQRIERFFDGSAESLRQAGAQDLAVRHAA
jgi:hypothetical protein